MGTQYGPECLVQICCFECISTEDRFALFVILPLTNETEGICSFRYFTPNLNETGGIQQTVGQSDGLSVGEMLCLRLLQQFSSHPNGTKVN